MDWSKHSVAVTGATGFIGGRLVEKLVLEKGANVRCLVRDFAHCAGLSRLKCEIVKGNLLDQDTLRNYLNGATFVIHCAYDWSGSPWAARKMNLEGAINLYRAATTVACRKFVHLSTDAVINRNKSTEVDETFPLSRDNHPYIATKVAIENAIRKTSRQTGAIPWTILRPAVVFGPGINTWTTQILRDILAGRQFLVADGQGVCNTTYVDNLVEAIFLACERKEANHETFLVTDNQPISWLEYLRPFATWCHQWAENFPSVSMPEAQTFISAQTHVVDKTINFLKQTLLNPQSRAAWSQFRTVVWTWRHLKPHLSNMLKARAERATDGSSAKSLLLSSDRVRVSAYTNAARYSIQKSVSCLGYQPVVGPTDALLRTEAWLRFARYIP